MLELYNRFLSVCRKAVKVSVILPTVKTQNPSVDDWSVDPLRKRPQVVMVFFSWEEGSHRRQRWRLPPYSSGSILIFSNWGILIFECPSGREVFAVLRVELLRAIQGETFDMNVASETKYGRVRSGI